MNEQSTLPPWAHPVTFWQAKCTVCGFIQTDYGDHAAYADWDTLPEVLEAWGVYQGWQFGPDESSCPDCTEKANPVEDDE